MILTRLDGQASLYLREATEREMSMRDDRMVRGALLLPERSSTRRASMLVP